MGEGNENFDFKRYLTCRKILRRRTSGFTSYQKEGVLWNFIARNIHRLGRVRTRKHGNYAERLPLIFLFQRTSTNFFTDAVAIFYGRYLKEKKTLKYNTFLL
jgi:hypothetical protein